MLFSRIWRTRSRVSPNWSPISSSPFSWQPMPKHSRMMSSLGQLLYRGVTLELLLELVDFVVNLVE